MHECRALVAFSRHGLASASGPSPSWIGVPAAHLLDQVVLRSRAPSDNGASNEQLVL